MTEVWPLRHPSFLYALIAPQWSNGWDLRRRADGWETATRFSMLTRQFSSMCTWWHAISRRPRLLTRNSTSHHNPAATQFLVSYPNLVSAAISYSIMPFTGSNSSHSYCPEPVSFDPQSQIHIPKECNLILLYPTLSDLTHKFVQ